MIRWKAEQVGVFEYWFRIEDEFGSPHWMDGSQISTPAFSILKEIMSDYVFAKKINRTETLFKYDGLSSDDRMELSLITITKLEDADNE
jgi:hypothetical protein